MTRPFTRKGFLEVNQKKQRWDPKLRGRLEDEEGAGFYGAAALLLDRFLAFDAARLDEANEG